eukprot:GDKJ01009450.1.p1 GENE.GDKJ01009450.1~~GDKJ01009450.1.p1  ORF type:complete len:261 (-),score=36.88 GDKJ01009450.1:93-875(-)
MTRHSKNCSSSSVFSYNERKRANEATQKKRIAGESMRPFEACWLCLQSARSPVSTPCGFIFCRECIILNFGTQRDEHKKNMKAYNKLQEFLAEKQKEVDEMESLKMIEDYKSKYESLLSANSSLSDIPESEKGSFSFLLPPAPPEKCILTNPITKKPLKLSSLIDLNPMIDGKDGKWLCPITQKPIVHQPAVAVIKSGEVFLKSSALDFLIPNKLEGVKNQDWTKEPISSMDDFVDLIPGATGFAAHNAVEAKSNAMHLR